MSTRVRQAFQSAAGAAGGGGLDVDEVFSTYLYTGNGTTQTITNGVDLDGEGGLVWIKPRDYAYPHYLYDSERSLTYHLGTHSTNGNSTDSDDSMDSFNSDGFTISGGANLNASWAVDYASWTFRKAPKFFDVVTYTGNGVTNRAIPHNLGCQAGMVIIKRLDLSNNWPVWHRSAASYGQTGGTYEGRLEDDVAFGWDTLGGASSTTFTVKTDTGVNANGGSYIAYVFAHNDGDGGFGPDSDQDIIKCGGYTGDGSSNGPEIDVGFEPQWLLIKRTDGTGDWLIMDSIRGIHANKEEPFLTANISQAESSDEWVRLLGNGFKIDTADTNINAQTGKYVYVAIRRGPLAVPESASDVFNVQTQGVNGYYGYLGKPVDLWINTEVSSGPILFRDRLRGGWYLLNQANTTEAQGGGDWYANNEGAFPTTNTSSMINWVWRRAPSFLDILAYRGSNSSLTLDHNLGVSPEMIWIKARNSPSSNDWFCWHKDLASIGDSTYPILSLTSNAGGYFNGNMTPTVSESSITIPSNVYISNASYEYISYMFATAPGVSKVGSYTGDGTTGRVIDCGFSTGARYIIIKRVAASGNWFIWDTTRGIVAGNDPYKLFNSQSAQNSSYDTVDPHNSGFIINQTTTNANVSGGKYIFYAIA